jgi:hypothetical protein
MAMLCDSGHPRQRRGLRPLYQHYLAKEAGPIDPPDVAGVTRAGM